MFICNSINSNKEYYPQIFLEQCKYAIKNRKITNRVNKDLELSESDNESNYQFDDGSDN